MQVYKATIDGVTEVAVKIFHDIHSQMQQADILREVAILKSCRCVSAALSTPLAPGRQCQLALSSCEGTVLS